MKEAADKRLERLLVMVPWITNREGPTVEEVCDRFAISERDLASDLEMLFMCGLYPFTPDTLMEADIVDGRVWIRYAEAFERPPTFTRQEAVSLVTVASAVLDLPQNQDNSALKSALAKLAAALGINDPEVVDIELAAAPTDVLDVVRSAAETRQSIELDYYSYGRDAWSRRTVEPYRIFNSEGQWYVQGRAVEADEIRNFRIDRMRDVRMLDQHFEVPSSVPAPTAYAARPDDPIVSLELSPQASWVLEQYPVESSERRADGTVTVSLRVSERAWLERLLLRLGPHARVVTGDIDLKSSARRLLCRYEAHQVGEHAELATKGQA